MKRSLLDKIEQPVKRTQDQWDVPTDLNISEIKNRLLDKFPIGLVPRNKIDEATGGILHQKTMATLDSRRLGIKGRVMIGNKICYPVDGILDHILGKIKDSAQC